MLRSRFLHYVAADLFYVVRVFLQKRIPDLLDTEPVVPSRTSIKFDSRQHEIVMCCLLLGHLFHGGEVDGLPNRDWLRTAKVSFRSIQGLPGPLQTLPRTICVAWHLGPYPFARCFVESNRSYT